MQLQVTEYSSKGITHCAKNKLLIAEISDMQLRRFECLYDDAADVGLALRNPHNGNVTRWSLLDEIRDPKENELLGWMLTPTPETVHAQPAVKGYQLNIIND